MANEISISAILVEMEDGSIKVHCPDLNINAQGKNADEAMRNIKDAVIRHVAQVGPDNIQLNPVKCMKIKIPV